MNHLWDIIEGPPSFVTTILPSQIEVSPFLQRHELVHFCHRKRIAVQVCVVVHTMDWAGSRACHVLLVVHACTRWDWRRPSGPGMGQRRPAVDTGRARQEGQRSTRKSLRSEPWEHPKA